MFIVFLLMGVCVIFDNNKMENIIKSSNLEFFDLVKLNIFFGVFILMLIVVIMFGVVMCIVKGN